MTRRSAYPRSVYQRVLSWIGLLVVLLIVAFLVLPAAVVTIAAFNDKAILSFPPQAWSLRWFARALAYEDFRQGFLNGLIVTAWSSTIALCVGAMFAFVIDRYRFPLKSLIEGILVSPLFIPHFTVGLGFLILAAQIGWTRGFAVVIVCHVILVLPFVLRSTYVSLKNLDQSVELAASSLGASPLRVLLTITLPLLVPGLVSGWLFATILSFNEFTASLFVTSQRTQTLPVAMYNYVREFADPSMAALSVMYIVGTAALIAFANTFLGLGKVLNIEQSN
jgi:putative spermidine/putrescine transport system permease protein